MTDEPGAFSPWHTERIRSADEARAEALATAHLELRGRSPDEIAARDEYLALLGVATARTVLEVGCGSGVVLRDLARRLPAAATAVGLDPSPALLAMARRLADEAGVGSSVQIVEGDARELPFDDASFDMVLAATTLLHVPDAERAIGEMVRVTRPAGRVGVLERDNDSYLIAHPDRELTRRIVTAGSDLSAVDSWIGRRLPRLLQAHGLADVGVRAFVSLERDPHGFLGTNGGPRWADMAVQAGRISEAERGSWLRQLDAVIASGGFLAGITQLFSWGTRPS
ncbi:MAG: methyltransferase domain-containing protein [Candidatus Limnocylindrales bacterium]